MAVRMPSELELPRGARRDLTPALHNLYEKAGKPPTRRISQWIMEDTSFPGRLSHEFVSQVLRGAAVPRWPNLEALIRVLETHKVVTSNTSSMNAIHALWARADAGAEDVLSGSGSTTLVVEPNIRTLDPSWQEVSLVANALMKLRGREGLTSLRLRKLSIATPLLTTLAVQRVVATENVDEVSAAITVVMRTVQGLPGVEQRVVADSILGLGVLATVYSAAGVDDRAIRALTAETVGTRRTAMLCNWNRLCFALDGHSSPSWAPSDRMLRGNLEPAVLEQLARAIVLGTLTGSPS